MCLTISWFLSGVEGSIWSHSKKNCSHVLKQPVRHWNQNGQLEEVHTDEIFVNEFV